MAQGDLILIGKEAVMTGLMIAAPFLLVSLGIGVIISIFQAATQIHEQNIVFVPKIIATALLLIFLGSWIISLLMNFTHTIFAFITNIA
jgi:flagellar biosynthetic protein FliQ